MTTRTNDGFTLIELIVVIAVLAILAAVALPKFADFSTKAETAAFDGVLGGLVAAVGIVHAKWLVESKPGTVSLDGGTMSINVAGFPTLNHAAQSNAALIWAKVMAGPAPTGWTQAQDSAAGWAEWDPPFSTASFGTDVLRYEEAGGKVCKVAAAGPCP